MTNETAHLPKRDQAMHLTEQAFHLLRRAAALIQLDQLETNAHSLVLDYYTGRDDTEGDKQCQTNEQ